MEEVLAAACSLVFSEKATVTRAVILVASVILTFVQPLPVLEGHYEHASMMQFQ
ncbi:MAG: hypothetical protein LBQ26_01465 [Holosporales bacterium]|nr:hypothetical protein [Holosporales bacterium]